MRKSMVEMHRDVLKRVTVDNYTKWYISKSGTATCLNDCLLDTLGHFTYYFFTPNQPLVVLRLYSELLIALCEAIVENACVKDSLPQLSVALSMCRSILQSADTDPWMDPIAACTSLGSFFTPHTDALDWDRMAMLFSALYICSSPDFSSRIVTLCEILHTQSDAKMAKVAQTVYNVPSSVRNAIRDTLRPFFRPEWIDRATACTTATQRIAHTLEYLIQRAYNLKCNPSTLAMFTNDNALRQNIGDQPYTLMRETVQAFASGNQKRLNLFYDNTIGDTTVCLFGLYHLACRNTVWLDSWIGSSVLASALYTGPHRLSIKLFHTEKPDPKRMTLWEQYRPVFDALMPPEKKTEDKEEALSAEEKAQLAERNSEKTKMQQYLSYLGLRLLNQKGLAEKLARAESVFQSLLAISDPMPDRIASALAGVLFSVQLSTSDANQRIQTALELNASETAREALQKQHDSLQRKSRHQENYADEVTRANAVYESEINKLRQQIEDQDAEKEDLKQQISQLLDLLDKGDEEESEPPAEAMFSFPADISPCTAYVFGGHTDFQTRLRQLIPGLRLVDTEQRFDKKALGYADIVFLQTRHMRHSMYFAVMDACSASNVPVCYLKDKSAKSAAVQILQEIQQLHEKT